MGLVEIEETGEVILAGSSNKSNRVKYTCPNCELNIWAKPEINVLCGDCRASFIAPVSK